MLNLVAVSMSSHHPHKARRYIDTYIKENPGEAAGLYFRGFVLLQLGDVKDAKASFHTFLRKADRSNIDQIQYLRITKRLLHDLDRDPEHSRDIH